MHAIKKIKLQEQPRIKCNLRKTTKISIDYMIAHEALVKLGAMYCQELNFTCHMTRSAFQSM